LEEKFGAVYTDKPGRPPLPTRLMAGLAILKHTFNLSDEVVDDRWVENPYYQYFCGEEFFRHTLPRLRQRVIEERSSDASVLPARRQDRAHHAPALCPCPPVQARAWARSALRPRGRDPHRRHEAIRS
jgi:hypothetical protein